MSMQRATSGAVMIRTITCSLFTLARLAAPLASAVADQVDELRALGAHVATNSASHVIAVDLSNAWLTDADLERLAHLPQLESINLAYTKITDEGLERLAPLKNVKVLDLYYA